MANSRKEIVSWCFYDWANSAFALTIMAGFFPVFFKTFWSAGVDPTVSTARLGFGNALAGLAVAVLSPFLGAIADAGRAKKKLLSFFIFTGSISSALLYFVGQGQWVVALSVFICASVAFNCANLFYDSLLIDVCDKKNMDMVSSAGYAFGYLGCGILFLLNVLMVSNPSAFGLKNAAMAVQISFLSAAVWWFLFSVPIILFVREKFYSEASGMKKIISESMHSLKDTVIKIIRNRELLVFFAAYWFYIDGLHTFVLMSVDFGMSIGITSKTLMISLLCVQFVAFPAALLFGLLSRKYGAFWMIMVGILIYILVCGIGALALRTQMHFIILAAITGLAQGSIQALSRSYFGKMVPPGESAEYFGFYNVMGRFAVIIGPAVVGLVAFLTHKAGISSGLASRIGMSSVSLLFLLGGLMLLWVELDKRAAAKKMQV